jgi:hypothetical protein
LIALKRIHEREFLYFILGAMYIKQS